MGHRLQQWTLLPVSCVLTSWSWHFIVYIFIDAFNIYPSAEIMRFYKPLREDAWDQRESSIIHMIMSPWIYMYNVQDYLNDNDRIQWNTDKIAMQVYESFTVSVVLHNALYVESYHRKADQRLTHPTYRLIGPVSPSCGLTRTTGVSASWRGPRATQCYRFGAYTTFRNWPIAPDSLWACPYLFYECETGALHLVVETRKM